MVEAQKMADFVYGHVFEVDSAAGGAAGELEVATVENDIGIGD